MSSLSIPAAVAGNHHIISDGKMAYAGFFSLLKKGDKPSLVLDDWMPTIGVQTREQMLAALASLVENEYARVDETVCPLTDMVDEQRVRITAHIHVEVLPLLPMDEESIDERRYPDPDVAGKDVAQFGKTVYRATVSRMIDEWNLTVRAERCGLEKTLIGETPHHSRQDAWAWFDGWVGRIRTQYAETGEVPGPTDRDAELVAHLKALGIKPSEARDAAMATTEEMEPTERIRRALDWLDRNGRPTVRIERAALAQPTLPENEPASELVDQLVALGYRRSEANRAANSVSLTSDPIANLRVCLTLLQGGSEPEEVEPSQEEVTERAARWAADRAEISIDELKAEFGLNHQAGIVVLAYLQRAGVIDDMGNPRPKILMDAEAVEAMLAGSGDGA